MSPAEARRHADRIAQEHGFDLAYMLAQTRCKKIIKARWQVIRHLYEIGMTLSAIGRVLNRDHTSIRHAVEAMGLAKRHNLYAPNLAGFPSVEERDVAVRNLSRDGVTTSYIAKRIGVTRQTIYSILRKAA